MYPEQIPQNNLNLRRIIVWSVAAIAGICIILLILSAIGYGQLKLSVPNGSKVLVNQHAVSASSVKLRSGSYTVTVYSATYEPYQTTVKINNFLTTSFKPSLKQRDPNALISSVLGSYGDYGAPTLFNSQWFENNSWLAGDVGPGSASQIALHFVNGSWIVGYFNGLSGYPTDYSKLPTEVANYLKQQVAGYANQ